MSSVSPSAYAEFPAQLDAPPQPNERLRRALTTMAGKARESGQRSFATLRCASPEPPKSTAIRGALVHAILEEAKAFDLALGFDPSPLEPMTLMITMADMRAAIEANSAQ